MKKFLFALAIVAVGSSSCDKINSTENAGNTAAPNAVAENTANTVAAAPANEQMAAFKFEESEYDFGTVVAGAEVKRTFKFTNVGEIPLTITNVGTTCGCTVPDWPKEPIVPGAQGQIDVVFNSTDKEGQQMKEITISANVEGGVAKLMIKGIVTPNAKATNTPGPPFKKK
jgi:hypothetical protein